MKYYRYLYALTLLFFMMPNFGMLFGKAGFLGRYYCLALLLPATVIFATRTKNRVPAGAIASFYVFLGYALLTAFWSENAALSLVKWGIYALLAIPLLIGGTIIPRKTDENPLWPMGWVFVVILGVSLVAFFLRFGWVGGNFRGFSGNSNALAASIFFCSPWYLFELRRRWKDKAMRRLLIMVGVLTFVIMVATFSRAACFAMLIMCVIATRGLKLQRKVLLAYVLVLMVVSLYLLRPSTFDVAYQNFVLKRSDDVLKSRTDQLNDTWEAAKQGGMLGRGLGVSIGMSRYWEISNHFSDFSREKGNSMLAIVEEIGIVGLLLYVALLYSLFGSLREAARKAGPDQKFLYNLALGFLVGSVFHSAFEAWFLSSGPDAADFWAMMGLFYGALLVRSPQFHDRFAEVEAATGPRIFVPSTIVRR